MKWEPYDPGWLVELAKKQKPEIDWLPCALSKCKSYRRDSKAYIRFMDLGKEPKSGFIWKDSLYNIVLNHPTKGAIVLDVIDGKWQGGIFIEDRRIVGIEFVDKV